MKASCSVSLAFRDHRLWRYAAKISRELAQEASRLDMTPSGDVDAAVREAAETAVASAQTLLRRLRGCCHYKLPE
jgi:hypothetical protein